MPFWPLLKRLVGKEPLELKPKLDLSASQSRLLSPR